MCGAAQQCQDVQGLVEQPTYVCAAAQQDKLRTRSGGASCSQATSLCGATQQKGRSMVGIRLRHGLMAEAPRQLYACSAVCSRVLTHV